MASLHPKRLSYEGKNVDYWLSILGAGRRSEQMAKATEATMAMGTNILPILVAHLDSRPGIYSLVTGSLEKRNGAVSAFYILGKSAAPVIPALERLVENGHYPMDAALALLGIGTNGIASLAKLAISEKPVARYTAVGALGNINSDWELAVPTLIACLDHKDPETRSRAASSLGRLRSTDPRIIVALQRTALSDSDAMVKATSSRVLSNILNQTRAPKFPESSPSQ